MQTCPECGTRSPAGAEFCSSCGTFLAWEDEQPPPRAGSPAPTTVPAPGPPPPRPAPRPDPPPPPPRSGPSSDHGRRPTQHNPEKVHKLPDEPDEPDPLEQDDRTVVLPRLPDHEPGAWRPSDHLPPDGTGRQGSSTVRGPGSIPPSRGPVAVPPGRTQTPPSRTPEHEPDRSLAPGEEPCPRCGAGNSPDRHFCRRCATELRREVTRAAPPPSRPPRQGRSPLVWVVVVLVALALLLWLVPKVLAAPDASGPGSSWVCSAGSGQADPEEIPSECSMSW